MRSGPGRSVPAEKTVSAQPFGSGTASRFRGPVQSGKREPAEFGGVNRAIECGLVEDDIDNFPGAAHDDSDESTTGLCGDFLLSEFVLGLLDLPLEVRGPDHQLALDR